MAENFECLERFRESKINEEIISEIASIVYPYLPQCIHLIVKRNPTIEVLVKLQELSMSVKSTLLSLIEYLDPTIETQIHVIIDEWVNKRFRTIYNEVVVER